MGLAATFWSAGTQTSLVDWFHWRKFGWLILVDGNDKMIYIYIVVFMLIWICEINMM